MKAPQRSAMNRFLVAMGFFAALSSATLAQRTQVCTASDADKPAVAKTVEDLFASVQAQDKAAFDALLAPGYFMFDRGERFEGDAIFGLILDLQKKGYKYVWTVPDPVIAVDCKTALITYENVGSVTLPDGTKKDAKWLESAFLVKASGRWRIRFFHSTMEQ